MLCSRTFIRIAVGLVFRGPLEASWGRDQLPGRPTLCALGHSEKLLGAGITMLERERNQ